jgi:thiamine-phosphate pyrophosphorylase
VVFRAFGAPDAAVRGRALARQARRRGVWFLVGADGALACRLGADGVHLPQLLAGRAGTIAALRRRFLITVAAHDLPAALRARRAGADAIVVSPVFRSASPTAGRPMGVMRFARLIRAAGAPAYALGGVNAQTAGRLKGSGAVGLAAVEGLCGPGSSKMEMRVVAHPTAPPPRRKKRAPRHLPHRAALAGEE